MYLSDCFKPFTIINKMDIVRMKLHGGSFE